MVPEVAFPPFTPSTYQYTAELERPVTLAVNCSVPEGRMQVWGFRTVTPVLPVC